MGVAEDVQTVLARWYDGLLANGEVVDRLRNLLTATNVDEVVAAVPDEWRQRFVDHLRDVSADGPMIRIFGGIYAYEREADPARLAAMKAEVKRKHAEEDAYFENVIRPAIRAWVARQSTRE
jgi:hypothetical protein